MFALLGGLYRGLYTRLKWNAITGTSDTSDPFKNPEAKLNSKKAFKRQRLNLNLETSDTLKSKS